MDGAERHVLGVVDGAGYTNKKPKLTIMSEKEKTELAVDLGRAVAEMRNHINYLLQEKITQHAPHISFEMVEILACLWREDGVNQQQLAALTVKDKSSITHLVGKLERELLV